MATREDLRTQIYRELRDPDGKSWEEQEINDLINAGINAVSEFSPLELREDITYTFPYTIVEGAFGKLKEVTTENDFHNVFRVTVLDANGKVDEDLPPSIGGTSTGWEFWAGKIQLPEQMYYRSTTVEVSGDKYEQIKLRVYGYGRHALLDDDVTPTTLSDQEQQACRTYVVAQALSRLMTDRANFQQWQIASGASDTSISELAVLANAARQRWFEERGRLRKMRRLA
jgi:hypothetical protein